MLNSTLSLRFQTDGVNKLPRNHLRRHLLTERQLEILNFVVYNELSPKQIAEKLKLSVRTIRFHIEAINSVYDENSFAITVVRYMKELDEWHPKTNNKN